MHKTHLSSIDLNLLVALEALIDESSVGRAAQRIHRSQPAMSRTLSRLRDLLGDPLLIKQGRSMVLSDRARALREPLKRLLGDADQLIRPPQAFDPRKERRHFRFVSSDYVHVVLFGAVLDALADQAPRISFTVLAPSSSPFEALASGQADLFFGPFSCPDWCVAEPLLVDPWACVRRRGSATPKTTAEYLALEHVDVAIEQRSGPIARALGKHASQRSTRLCVQDFAGALFVAATSRLVATVPRPVARRAAKLLPIVVSEVPFKIESATIAMIWPKRAATEPAHVWLREIVRRAVPQGL